MFVVVINWFAICIILLFLPLICSICVLVGGFLIDMDEIGKFYNSQTFKFSISTSSKNLLAIENKAAINITVSYPDVEFIGCDQEMSIEVVGVDSAYAIKSHSMVFRSKTKPSKKQLVLVHGANSGPPVWFPCAPSLVEKGYEVHCLALPGFGETFITENILKLSKEQLLQLFVNYIKVYIHETCPSTKAYVVGHSFGAYLAAALACRHPECCEVNVFVNGPGIFPILDASSIYWCILFNWGVPNFLARQIGSSLNAVLFAYLSFSHYTDPLVYWDIAQMTCSESFGDILVSRFIFFDGYQGRFNCTILSELVSSETVPIAMVWGTNDIITPLHVAEFFSTLSMHTTDPLGIEYINAGHNPISKNHGVDFAVALMNTIEKAQKLVKVNPAGKMKIDQVLENVYASFSLSETKCRIDKLFTSIHSIVKDEQYLLVSSSSIVTSIGEVNESFEE